MNERDGFIFYRSFWDAVNQLPTKDQLPVLKAIICYGLDGTEPQKLTPTQNAFFLLSKPVLLKGRNKAANGKKGGSKLKANSKQTESKNESASGLLLSDVTQGSNTNVLQNKMNDERGRIEISPRVEKSFESFWKAYPENAKGSKQAALEAWVKLAIDPEEADQIMTCLEGWKKSKRWTDDDGEYIPKPENFLVPTKGYLFKTPAPAKQPIPKGASGVLGEAELEAIQRVLSEE